MKTPSPTPFPPRCNVLGIGIHAVNLDSAEAIIAATIDARTPSYVTVTGVHGVSIAHEDPGFHRILYNARLCTPDGMPLVWMGRLQGYREIGRVYGPDLMLRLCDHGRARGWRHFFLGGKPGVADELARRLADRFPGLEVAGCFSPPFRSLSAAEIEHLCLSLRASHPHVLWIGLSTPKQERFMAAHLGKFPVPLMIGVGAAFDIHAGLLPQAPRWMRHAGLEWFFRLCVEPRRLWRRYLRNNPLFLARAFLQLTGLRRYPNPDGPATP